MYKLLTINPGSTSTKIAVYEDERQIFSHTFEHDVKELEQFVSLNDQIPYRTELILEFLKNEGYYPSVFDGIVARGGMLPPIETGGYVINDAMKDCLMYRPAMQHASNLGALIADKIASPFKIPAWIYDAVVSDELPPEAKITGFPEIERQSFSHVLNARAMARKAAEQSGKKYEDCNYIVVHMGGGVSVAAHAKGRMIDSVSDDAGPFSPDRSGSVNLMYLVDLCFDSGLDKKTIMKKIRGAGGMKAHLGTHDLREVEKRIIEGDEKAKLVFDAMALQIAKGAGCMMGVFEEPIDGVILTGGLANSKSLVAAITKRLEHLLPIIVLPGENEMESLALGGLRILRGEEQAKTFVGF